MDSKVLQSKVESLLKQKHLTKVALSEALGIPKQNLCRIYNTQKMPQMFVVANFLGVSLEDLLVSDDDILSRHQIDGFLEIDGVIHRVKSLDGLKEIIDSLTDEA